MSEEREFDSNMNKLGTVLLFAFGIVPPMLAESRLGLMEKIEWNVESKWIPLMLGGWVLFGCSVGFSKGIAKLVSKRKEKYELTQFYSRWFGLPCLALTLISLPFLTK